MIAMGILPTVDLYIAVTETLMGTRDGKQDLQTFEPQDLVLGH